MGRQLTLLLAASLAVNVFLGGFVAGRLAGGPSLDGPPEAPGPRVGDVGAGGETGRGGGRLFRNASGLSPEGRAAFLSAFAARRDSLGDFHRERTALVSELMEAVGTEPFDRARVEAAIAAINARETEHRALQSEVLVDAVSALSPEDRRRLVETQASDRRRRLHRLFDDTRPPPPPPGD